MKLYLIRHGATIGNTEGRYVGSTDESILPKSVEELEGKVLPKVDKLFVSPMKRCMETADVLFPNQKQVIVSGLKECDFGEFEYRNYKELEGNRDYQRFIDSMGMCGFPGGEARQTFQERCVSAFDEAMRTAMQNLGNKLDNIAMVVHGGTIMAILDKYSKPHRDYYEWQVKNGCGFGMDVVWSKDGKVASLEQIVKFS